MNGGTLAVGTPQACFRKGVGGGYTSTCLQARTKRLFWKNGYSLTRNSWNSPYITKMAPFHMA